MGVSRIPRAEDRKEIASPARTPSCPLWTLCEGFLKAAKVLRLNNPDGAASDESIQEAGG
jgi:hypothetical protein